MAGIGSSNAIETNLFSVDARNTNGVALANGNIRLSEVNLGGALQVTANNQAFGGDILIQAANGDLIVFGAGVSNDSGPILLLTTAANRDVIVNSAVTSIAGNVSLISGDDVLINANVSTRTSSIYVEAGNGNVSGAGTDGIIMADNTRAESFGGFIRLQANNSSDIVLGALDTVDINPSLGSVVLKATRSILAGSGDLNELNVDTGVLLAVADSDLNGTGSIGQADTLNGTPNLNAQAINIRVETLAADSAQGIYFEEADGLTIDNISGAFAFRVNINGSQTLIAEPDLSDVQNRTTGQ